MFGERSPSPDRFNPKKINKTMIPTIVAAIPNLRAVEDARPCPFVLTICLPT
jgi:hypothetical protein